MCVRCSHGISSVHTRGPGQHLSTSSTPGRAPMAETMQVGPCLGGEPGVEEEPLQHRPPAGLAGLSKQPVRLLWLNWAGKGT